MMTRGKAKPRQWPEEEGYQRFGTPDAESPEKRNSEVNLTTRQQKIITPRSNISLRGAQGGSPDERPIIGRFGRPLPLPPSIVKEREGHLDQVASEAPPRPMAPGGDDGIRAEALAGGRDNHIDLDNPFANIEEDQAPMAPGILRQRPVHEERGDYRDAVPPAARPELIRNPWGAAPHNNMPSSYQVSTPIFTGKGRWTTFIKQFQAIGITAHWTEQEKLHYLLVSLKEEAAEYAFDLEDDILEDYDALVHELALRFRVTSTRDSSQQLFYSRKIKPHESLREYAADLKRLILRAFPRGVSVEVREDMTLKQFFDGLHDEDARFHVKTLQHPRNIDHAVELVQQYYNYCSKKGPLSKTRIVTPLDRGEDLTGRGRGTARANRLQTVKRGKFEKKGVEIQDEAVRFLQEQKPKSRNAPNELDQLTQSVHNMGEKVIASVEGMSKTFMKFLEQTKPPQNWKKSATCYKCGVVGHISRDCPSGSNMGRSSNGLASQGNLSGST